MPELPEVETIKNVLKSIVVGKTITKVDVYSNTLLIKNNKADFISALTNQTFKDITRIGKYLFFHLSNDLVLISHLRMEGKYYDLLETNKDSYYAKAIFHLNDGHKLCYDDSRAFGIMILSNESNYMKEPEIAKLGPEPFDLKNGEDIYNSLRKNRKPIKTTITDQSIIAGIGNIYADEILYACHIHPHTHTNLVTLSDWNNIIDQAKIILTKSIKYGGSTIKSYHPGKDIDGKFQTEIKIYGKGGEVCPACGKTFQFIKTGGRGTTYCPGCQHKLGAPINVAVTGPIASGKSKLTSLLASYGADSISSDQIVIDLYTKKHVIKTVAKMFNLPFTDSVDKKVLRDYVLTHKDAKKRLENYIHPLVIAEIENFLKTSKAKIRVVEVPLLFESKSDTMFDSIIVVESSEQSRDDRLMKRSGNLLNKELVTSTAFIKNKNKAEFLVSNDGSLKDLEANAVQIFNTLTSRLN